MVNVRKPANLEVVAPMVLPAKQATYLAQSKAFVFLWVMSMLVVAIRIASIITDVPKVLVPPFALSQETAGKVTIVRLVLVKNLTQSLVP